MDNEKPRTYTNEQVNAILRRALDNQLSGGGVMHADLVDVGKEIGLSKDEIERAAREEYADRTRSETRKTWQRRRVQGFISAFLVYVIVNAALFMINRLTGGSSWFVWPLLGWGIAIALHALRVFGPSDAAFESHLQKQRAREEKDRRRAEKELEKQRARSLVKEAGGRFKDALERGVGALLHRAADELNAVASSASRDQSKTQNSSTQAGSATGVRAMPESQPAQMQTPAPQAEEQSIDFGRHVESQKVNRMP